MSRRAAELGVHMAIIRGRFVVFVAGTIAAGAVAGVVGGASLFLIHHTTYTLFRCKRRLRRQ